MTPFYKCDRTYRIQRFSTKNTPARKPIFKSYYGTWRRNHWVRKVAVNLCLGMCQHKSIYSSSGFQSGFRRITLHRKHTYLRMGSLEQHTTGILSFWYFTYPPRWVVAIFHKNGKRLTSQLTVCLGLCAYALVACFIMDLSLSALQQAYQY